MSVLDTCISEFDRGLRTLFAKPSSVREHPDQSVPEADLTAAEKKHAAGLMRVNHTGEVCAQALYSGQALTSRDASVTAALQQAALEETEHLAWCASRVDTLGGRTSVLNPVFYAGSFSMGIVAGAFGDKWNLGFLAETEQQVGKHLASHLDALPANDQKSKTIVAQMQLDEAEHAKQAWDHGAAPLPKPVKVLMTGVSKLMTKASYYV